MSTKIQKYLREGGCLEALEQSHAIRHRRHREHPELVMLKYVDPQVALKRYGRAPNFDDEMVRECRGIILVENEGWRVACRTFDKFFNVGETRHDGAPLEHASHVEATFDWESASVHEKLDGSLIQMFYHKGNWLAATSGSPDGSGAVQQAGSGDSLQNPNVGSFSSLFWSTFERVGGRHPSKLPEARHAELQRLSLAFELTGPENRVVVVYENADLRLLAARYNDCGVEVALPQIEHAVQIPRAESFPLHSLASCAESFERFAPTTLEGYVVSARRLFPDPPACGAGSRSSIRGTTHSTTRRRGSQRDVFSRWRELTNPPASFKGSQTSRSSTNNKDTCTSRCSAASQRHLYLTLLGRIQDDFSALKAQELSQREFAGLAQQHIWSKALFGMRQGRALQDIMLALPIDLVTRWISLSSAPIKDT